MGKVIVSGVFFGLTVALLMVGTAQAEDAKAQVQVGGGAYITQVYDGWPATRARTARGLPARLEGGDRIIAVDGMPIRTAEDLGAALQWCRGVAQRDVIKFGGILHRQAGIEERAVGLFLQEPHPSQIAVPRSQFFADVEAALLTLLRTPKKWHLVCSLSGWMSNREACHALQDGLRGINRRRPGAPDQ